MFSWVCWITPNNVVVNQLFGVYSGLGMGVITFDWSQISWIGSPLMIPWWAEVQIFGGMLIRPAFIVLVVENPTGFVVFYWILTPILYYTNVSLAMYLNEIPLTRHDAGLEFRAFPYIFD
jgi:OPT oligopeptide transporter protein